ncbi:MAG TPA: hypothetical protein VN603_11705 [Candidatus Acidoferrales bacterium]|nr:hypothetical protein [Candidatus Acidoferrales bacterium]
MTGAVGPIALVYVNLVAVAGPEPAALLRGALVPTIPGSSALLVIVADTATLLLWSQTALCLVLPVALVPLLALVRPYGSRFFTGTLLATAIRIVLDVAMLVVTFFRRLE